MPQGSILGPLLFLLYINDLSSVSEYCCSVLFADDANVFMSRENIDVLCSRFNEELESIREWLCCNKLSLNVSKTHYMIFTPRNKIVHDIGVKIHGVSVERVNATKFLGVIIDSKLTPCWIYLQKVIQMCWNYCQSQEKVAQVVTHHSLLFIRLPIFYLLQPCVGKQLYVHFRKK